MTYNVLNYQGSISGDSEKEIALRMIIDSADPDLIVVEELNNTTGYNRFLSHILNYNQEEIYSGADFTDQSSANADIALYYKPDVFSFVSTSVINTTNNWGNRDVIEFVMKHIESNEEIRLYGLHLKAGTDGDDETEREQEATALRNYLNTLNPTEHFFVLGDFNFYDSNEGGFQVLTESQEDNDGQVFDPINRIGNWHNSSSYSDVHTQSTRATDYEDGGASGGMDDRFDFIFVSSSVLSASDVNYVENSYTSYGNDGNHFNQSINAGNNSAVPDEIADALYEASDHLPVYMDVVFSGTLPPMRQIVISEIMPNPSSVLDSNGEWFEVYNADSVTVDFAGWTIKDAGTDEHFINVPESSLLVEPGEYFVFGRNGSQNENGGYIADYEYGNTMSFSNVEDEIIIFDPEWREVDKVYYTHAFPYATGASMYVQDLSSNNNIISNWAESTTPFGLGDLGTPGEPSPSMSSSTLTIPHKIHLYQNYPNPFNSITILSYEISEPGYMQLAIFNLSGQKVEILEEGLKHPGIFHVYWKTSTLPSGVYFSQFLFGDQILSKKLVLLK
jgi:endonuclease/exonuclease/phosphatase family metal-dependent hydrolase